MFLPIITMALKSDSDPQIGMNMLCSRCSILPATMPIRNDKDKVCVPCFLQYVTTKAVKRMETYKSRPPGANAPRKLLLPISFGPSSTSLLSILDNHLHGQLDRMGRTTYTLILVHVNLAMDSAQSSKILSQLEKIKSRFPDHKCLSTDITEAFNLDIDWKSLGLEDPMKESSSVLDKAQLDGLLKTISSTTSRADVLATLLTRLLVNIAKKNDCQSILFGDSTTRLAEKTLIETAKGRGFSLRWQVSDGLSPLGVNFLYPMRELLKKELLDFTSLTSPPLSDLVIYQATASDVSASAKSTTIDDLMAHYFETVEEKFPAIVANVVRTSSKLKAPADIENLARCGLCGLPVSDGTDGINGWGGDQSFNARSVKFEHRHGAILCYGCSRSIHG